MTSVTDQNQETVDIAVLKTILNNLVTVPEEVKIERKVDEQGVILSVMVSAKDMGIVIGRSGSMASTIKTIMRAIGKANKMNIRIQFLEPDGTIKYSANKPKSESNEKEDSQAEKESIKQASQSLDDDLQDFVVN
jgi:predicted RNA-binding protein YlqC (UPF0109 family)